MRSAAVMEHTMASTLPTSPSSIWPAAWRISLDMPGIRRMRPPSEPIFFTWRSCERKSSSVNWPYMRRLALFATSSVSMVRSACSIRLSTSPMPRIRSAMRSGWKRSKSSSRSPVLANAIGLPTTPLTDERGAAAGVAVELGQDDAAQLERVVERLGGGDGVLTDHGVDHQERVVRLRRRRDVTDLLHELGVDGEAARGVDDADVPAEPPRFFHPGPRAADGIGRLREDGHADLVSEHAQLLDSRRALQVGADKERVAALLLPPPGELRRVGRLARSLEARHEHDRRWSRRVGELEGLAPEDGDQLLVHRLDDLLAGRQALRQRLGADPQSDAVAETPGHAELDIGLEERGADLLERLVEVLVADAALAAQAGGDPLQAVGEGVEHEVSG